MPTEIPPERAAQYHVRCEVLMPHDPSSADPARQAVGQYFRQGAGIFVGNHTGNCPTDGRVFRRKRRATLKKMAAPRAGKGPLPSEGIFEDFRIEQCVDAGFSAENSRFALLLVIRIMAQQEHSAADAGHGGKTGIGGGHRV